MKELTIPEFNALVARTLSEKAWTEHVRRLALALSWRYYHTHDSRRSPAGFPDCVLVRGERLIFAELKRGSGKLTEAQGNWLGELANVPGVECYLWYPSDRDEVLEILR